MERQLIADYRRSIEDSLARLNASGGIGLAARADPWFRVCQGEQRGGPGARGGKPFSMRDHGISPMLRQRLAHPQSRPSIGESRGRPGC